MESQSEMIWNCFEQLGEKLDKDFKKTTEKKDEIVMYSKDSKTILHFNFKKRSVCGLQALYSGLDSLQILNFFTIFIF